MDDRLHALGPSSPTVQEPVKQREAEDEKQPLLGSVEARQSGFQRQVSVVDVVKHMKRPSTWNWRNVLVLVSLWFAYGFVSAAYSVIGPFFPDEALVKGSSSTTTGIIISAAPFSVAVFSPFIGYYLPRLGLRYTLVSGLLLVGGAYVLMGFTSLMPTGWVFILFCVLLRMTEGVGSAMFFTSAFALLPELFPRHVATVMAVGETAWQLPRVQTVYGCYVTGVFEVGSGLGYAAGPPLGGFLYAAGGFKLPFIAVGGAVLVFVPLTFLLVGNMSYKVKKTMAWKSALKISTSLVMILLFLANLLILAGFGFITPTLEPFLTSNFHLTPEQVGLVFLSCPLLYLLLTLVAGQLSDKFGPRWFEIFGFFLCGVGYAFLGPPDFVAKPELWITTVAFSLVGAGAAFAAVPVYSDMLTLGKSMNLEEDQDAIVGVLSGMTTSAYSVGEFIGPLIGGVMVTFLQFQDSCIIFGELLFAEAFLLLGATLIDMCYKRTRH